MVSKGRRINTDSRPVPVVLFVVSEDWYFVSHRLRLAQAAIERGYRVTLVTRCSHHCEDLRRIGIHVVELDIARSRTNPLRDLASLSRLTRVMWRQEPDIVYAVALKPVLIGLLAARLAGVRGRVAALGGLGFVFGAVGVRRRMLRAVVLRFLRRSTADAEVIVQNAADAQIMTEQAEVPSVQLHLIAGAGVDLARFRPLPEPVPGLVMISMVSRMLWDKGVGELVAAAKLLRGRDVAARVRLVGQPDADNPGSIDADQLAAWVDEGLVEWHGAAEDIPEIWAASHIAALPSYYREGVPKSLLEAAACGRPIVTTDWPGCRDAILPGESGLLVPPRDVTALADALQRLVENGDLRRRMGRRAREDAEARFSDLAINSRILDLCDRMLGRDGN